MSRNNIVLISEFVAPYNFISIWEKKRVVLLDKNKSQIEKIEKLFIIKE